MFNIYVQVLDGKILSVNAGDYEITSDGWHLVYSGTEEDAPDLFPKGLMSANGGVNYALVNGEVMERNAEEIAADEEAANPPQNTATQEERIAELEAALDLLLSGVTE